MILHVKQNSGVPRVDGIPECWEASSFRFLVLLDAVKHGVCGSQKGPRVRHARIRDGSHPKADGNGNGNLSVQHGTVLEVLLKPVEELAHLLGGGTRQNDHELVSPISRYHITVAGDFYKTARDILKQGVAALVAVTVVHIFKVIDVEKGK